jgi:hypothetical protein
MNNNNNLSGGICPKGVLSSIASNSISESEIEQTIIVNDSVPINKLDELKSTSEKWYIQSRTDKYRAIGYAYVWFHAAKGNPAYLEQAFENLPKHSANADYLNSLKHCLNITNKKQASSLTKYAKVMRIVDQKLGVDGIDFSAAGEFVEKIVDLITTNGGLDKMAEEVEGNAPRKTTVDDGEESDDGDENADEAEPTEGGAEPDTSGNVVSIETAKSRRPKATGEYFDTQMREYLKATPVASFKACGVENSTSGLVIAVGVQDGDSINVVDLLADPDVLKAVIKATASIRSNADYAQGQS